METKQAVEEYIADLHIHSRYSRATSRECVPEYLDLWAGRKGIRLLGTGDFTHPAWRTELKEKLRPAEEGLYVLKDEYRRKNDTAGAGEPPRFVVSGEISSIYKKNGRVRKVHNLILLPGLDEAEAIAVKLEAIGNIHSDGRPILGLDSRDLLEIVLDACPQAVFIPAHIWTPHFSLFGAFSGFDTIEECFGDLTPYIHALETGLSSDPPMNWRLSALDSYRLVSNSDAHSPSKLGREANLFAAALSYPALASALNGTERDGFMGTIEFFPEEGKYHLDGHRNCGQCLTPSEAEQAGGKCPVCGRKLTTGVLHRVEQLADRPEGFVLPGAPPFESLVPLAEVIAASTGRSASGVRVTAQYEALLRELGPEFYILRKAPLPDVEKAAGPCVAEGIRRMRCGKVKRIPGYDGEYGKIGLLDKEEIDRLSGQLCFFGAEPRKKDPKPRAVSAVQKAAKKEAELSEELLPARNGDLMAELNEEQRMAVTATEPAVAVIAGPGTGKTKTLVSRIVYLVKERGVKPSAITAVTFTNIAAGVMRERLEKAFGGRREIKGMTIGTFHAIGLRLLEEQGMTAAVADEAEVEAAASEVIGEFSLSLSPAKFLQTVSRIKNGGAASGQIPQAALSAYDRRLESAGVLDFDDILIRSLSLSENGAVGKERFSFLLVDEFQDINDIQYRLVEAWSRKGSSLFVIGDPDQAIYGFRGSDSRCFDRLRETFPALRSIRLVKNYRSAPPILRCALPVIDRNPPPEGGRALEPQRDKGAPVRRLQAPDEFSEGIFIAKEINRMVGGMDMLDAQSLRIRNASVGFSDIAVLYRTHRQAETLETCLRREGIPYTVTGRESYLSDESVRGTLGFFRFLLNPADKSGLRACLQSLGCPRKTIRAFEEQIPHPEKIRSSGDLPSGFQTEEGLRKWAELTEAYALRVRKEKPSALIREWLDDSGLPEKEPLLRLQRAAVFHNRFSGFLRNLATGEEGDICRSGEKSYRGDAVSLMTLHGSKGLEFPVVFLCGVRRGVLPLEQPGQTTDIAEERRLFYVGITRAKEELLLLNSGEASCFLEDIPTFLLDIGHTMEGAPPYGGKQLSLFE